MRSAKMPLDEVKRLKVLKSFKVLDTLPEDNYDNITKIAAEICNTPIALISIIDENRQWFKSKYGLNANETPRDYAFCAHSILAPDDLFIVPDATIDLRFKNNPLTTNYPNVIFYAGAPLISKDGFALGTLCVIDNQSRATLTDGQKISLKALSKQVVSLLELRKRNIELNQTNNEIIRLNKELTQFAYRLSHDLKTPISGINALTTFIKEDLPGSTINPNVYEWINLIFSRTSYIESLVESLLNYTQVTNSDIIIEKFNLKNLLMDIINNCELNEVIINNLDQFDIEICHSKVSFMQIFHNLLANSKKFAVTDKCLINIDFIDSKDFYQFIYSDNGPGIDSKYRDKVFHIFETLDDISSKNTGFGLAIVKSIIDRLGGWISLNEKIEGKGACFEFTICKSFP